MLLSFSKPKAEVQRISLRYFFKGFQFTRLDDRRVQLFKLVKCEECGIDLSLGQYTIYALDDRALMHEGLVMFLGDIPPKAYTLPYDVDVAAITCKGCREAFLNPIQYRGYI